MQKSSYLIVPYVENNIRTAWSVVIRSSGEEVTKRKTRESARQWKRFLEQNKIGHIPDTFSPPVKNLVATVDPNEVPVSVGNTSDINKTQLLSLTKDEVNTLITILGKVAGCPTDSHRKHSASIITKLGGFRFIDGFHEFADGHIEFFTTKELAAKAKQARLTLRS